MEITTDCGCLNATPIATTISPGNSIIIPFHLSTDIGPGPFSKSINVEYCPVSSSNIMKPSKLVLTVKGNIDFDPQLCSIPKTVNFGIIHGTSQSTRQLYLSRMDASSVGDITSISWVSDSVSKYFMPCKFRKVDHIESHNSIALEVTLQNDTAKIGKYNFAIVLTTNHDKFSTLIVPATVIVE